MMRQPVTIYDDVDTTLSVESPEAECAFRDGSYSKQSCITFYCGYPNLGTSWSKIRNVNSGVFHIDL